jgi:hypothetical protein
MTSIDRTRFWRMFARSVASNLYLNGRQPTASPPRFSRAGHEIMTGLFEFPIQSQDRPQR